MKELVEFLIKKDVVCKELNEIKLDTRKKIKAYLGVNLKNEYCFILIVNKKSRILKKDIEEFFKFLPNINFRYKKKILITKAPICSKAMELIKDWRVLWY